MPKPDHARSEPLAERAELARLVRRIQALALELQEPRRRELDQADVEAREGLHEQLRWRLAAVAHVPQPMSSATPHDDRGGRLDGPNRADCNRFTNQRVSSG
jgi:hypothetical protein